MQKTIRQEIIVKILLTCLILWQPTLGVPTSARVARQVQSPFSNSGSLSASNQGVPENKQGQIGDFCSNLANDPDRAKICADLAARGGTAQRTDDRVRRPLDSAPAGSGSGGAGVQSDIPRGDSALSGSPHQSGLFQGGAGQGALPSGPAASAAAGNNAGNQISSVLSSLGIDKLLAGGLAGKGLTG